MIAGSLGTMFGVGPVFFANAAILAAEILGNSRPEIRARIRVLREKRKAEVLAERLP